MYIALWSSAATVHPHRAHGRIPTGRKWNLRRNWDSPLTVCCKPEFKFCLISCGNAAKYRNLKNSSWKIKTLHTLKSRRWTGDGWCLTEEKLWMWRNSIIFKWTTFFSQIWTLNCFSNSLKNEPLVKVKTSNKHAALKWKQRDDFYTLDSFNSSNISWFPNYKNNLYKHVCSSVELTNDWGELHLPGVSNFEYSFKEN